jgi:hypothetical protein
VKLLLARKEQRRALPLTAVVSFHLMLIEVSLSSEINFGRLNLSCALLRL